jgi:hypothetical protein
MWNLIGFFIVLIVCFQIASMLIGLFTVAVVAVVSWLAEIFKNERPN